MTEEDWLAATEIGPSTIVSLHPQPSDRKLRLFAIACCQRIERLYRNSQPLLDALEMAERFAEGKADSMERRKARREAQSAINDLQYPHAGQAIYHSLNRTAVMCAINSAANVAITVQREAASNARVTGNNQRTAYEAASLNETKAQLALLRCIVGNPFRPISFDPSWLTQTVVSLARHMYDTRDFSAMPILADALQESGCADDQILNHCRGQCPHVRGCWVVDGCLAK